MFYYVLTGEKLFVMSGCNGTLNWIFLFTDDIRLIKVSKRGLSRLFKKNYLE